MAAKWLPVPGWEGWYEVSSEGMVRRIAPGHHTRPGYVLRPYLGRALLYLRVRLHRPDRRFQRPVHTLVASAFLGPRPSGMEVDHIDGDPKNNAATNLQYLTKRDNLAKRRLSDR